MSFFNPNYLDHLLMALAYKCLVELPDPPAREFRACPPPTPGGAELIVVYRPRRTERDPGKPGKPGEGEMEAVLKHYFSPKERLIVTSVAAEDGLSAKAVGGRLAKNHGVHLLDANGQAGDELRVLLANLLNRNVLAKNDKGYALETGSRAIWEAHFTGVP